MTREAAVLITLIAYKVTLIVIGVLAKRKTRDGLDFFLGGRALGPTVAALSASASSSSAWTLLGVSGAAYAWGFSALWLFPACVGGFVLNWYVLAPALQRLSHRSGALTVTEVLAGPPERPLSWTLSRVASFIVLVSLGTYVASQFQGAGKAFSETFGLSLTASILVGSGVVVLYTLLGGFWAVSLTDTLQGLVMAGTSLILPLAALAAIGGPSGFLTGLSQLESGGYLSLTRNLAPMAGLGFILGLLGIGLGYPGQPHVVNRFMALREGSASLRRAQLIAIGWAVVVYSGMLLLGLCGRILYPQLLDPEVVFIVAANQLFPAVLSGVMLAAVLSAIMSTADSQLLVAASSVTHDLRLGGPTAGSLLLRSRVVVLVLSLGAVLAALLGSREIFATVLFAWTAMGAAFGPLLVVTALRGVVSPGRSLAAMVLGFSLSVLAYSFAETQGGAMERVFPFVVALAVILLPSPRELVALLRKGVRP
ncbi:sodium/proline symporter [Acidobacteria bacterium AH-259-G07]|nr:sodium/proline symporter [Acidobacteria bacterium AH-259-G07]